MKTHIGNAIPKVSPRMIFFECLVAALISLLGSPAFAATSVAVSTSNQPNAVEATMSATGGAVAFVSNANGGATTKTRTIYLGTTSSASAIGRGSLAYLQYAFYNPKLSADGRYLTFAAYYNNGSSIQYVIPLYFNGSYYEMAEDNYNDAFPAVSTTGTVVFNSLIIW